MFVVGGGVAGVWMEGGGGGGGGIVVAKGDTAEISPTYSHSVLSHTQIQMNSNENREAGNSLVINKVTIKLKWRHTQMRVPTKFSYHLFPNKCVYMKKSSMITELVIKFNERMTKKSIDALAGLHFKILKSAMLHVV